MNTQNIDNTELRYKQLQDFETEVDWQKLVELIVHHYIKSGIGRLKVPVESMIRIYFLQLRYNLNSSEVSLAVSKIDILQCFALIDNRTDISPDVESIDTFRSLIELKGLAPEFIETFNIQPMLQAH